MKKLISPFFLNSVLVYQSGIENFVLVNAISDPNLSGF